MKPESWRGLRVFLTGHTGFKGGWLSWLLSELGADVTGYALEPEESPNIFSAAHVGQRVRSIIGDVRDAAAMQGAMVESKPDVVLHLAAQSLVLPSYERPVETYATNVMGTVHVLDAARQIASVRAIVIVTSDKCYENQEWHWGYRETDKLGGRDPYSNSKACAELVTSAYRQSFFDGKVGVATVRAGNVIGGGDFAPHRIVPDFVRSMTQGRALSVRNPASTRPWQHVLEPLEGYLLVAERLLSGDRDGEGPWNFGPEAESIQPVGRVVDDLCAEWKAGAGWKHEPTPQPHEAGLLALDSTRARRALGWRPRLGYREGLRWTVEWYKAFHAGEDPEAVTRAQVTRFLEPST